jgi:hypothetical protein
MRLYRCDYPTSAARSRVKIGFCTAALLLVGAGAAAAACPTPRITHLSERHGPNCGAATCGFIIVHWVGNKACDHYNIRERSGTQFEAPGIDRNQLINRRSAQFPGRFTPNITIHVAIQGCTRSIFGKSSCSPWSPAVSFHVNDTSPRGKYCEGYATRAVGTVKYARDMKCDPRVIGGPRWSPNREEHRSWCLKASADAIRREERARATIAQQCRIQAGMPQSGQTQLSVTAKGGDTFTLSISGFAPNVPVIIDVGGPGAQPGAITVDMRGNRIVAGANGAVTVTLFGAKVCKRGGGRIEFTARDQDGRRSNRATSTCAP